MDLATFLWEGRHGELQDAAAVAEGGGRGNALHQDDPESGREDVDMDNVGVDGSLSQCWSMDSCVVRGDTLAAAAEAYHLIGVQDEWKPSWSALAVPSRSFTLHTVRGLSDNVTGPARDAHTGSPVEPHAASIDDKTESRQLGIRLHARYSSLGGMPCTAVCAINPGAAAATSGMACGDVLLELNGEMQLGLVPRRVEETLARVWNEGTEITIVVVPAMQARVLTRAARPTSASSASISSQEPDRDPSEADAEAETERVVLGIIRIPNLSDKVDRTSSSRASMLGRFFGGKSPPTRRSRNPNGQGLTAQTARAYILQQAINMLTALDPTDTTSVIHVWLSQIRPQLVKEFGEGLIDANNEFLLELVSNHNVSQNDPVVITESVGGHPGGIEAGKDDRGVDPNSGAYVYIDTASEAGQRHLDAALSAAQSAWAAEKSRRRATELLTYGSPEPDGSPHDVQESISVNDGPTDGESQGVPSFGKSTEVDAKAAARAHRLALEAHAKEALASAEEAWRAEKKLYEAKHAKVGEKPGLQHSRILGGRVVQRQRTALMEASSDPEPNRPWFGGASAENGTP